MILLVIFDIIVLRGDYMIEHQYFNGYKFTKDKKTGYYLSSKKINGSRKRLHVYVWEYYNGPVPKGFHIHHIDENKDNNNIENLKLISSSRHSKLHSKENVESNYEEISKNMKENALPKAIEWHKSKEGREWHKKQYEKIKERFHTKEEYICLYCGTKFVTQKGNNKFCSNKCKSAYRRKSGVDNEERYCEICGKAFTANKYSTKKMCSKECSLEYRRKNRKN